MILFILPALASTVAMAIPPLNTGTRYSKVASAEDGSLRICAFDENFGRFGSIIYEQLVAAPSAGSPRKVFTSETPKNLETPSRYYEIVGDVFSKRSTYSQSNVSGPTTTTSYTLQDRDNNSQGSDKFFTFASFGKVVGQVDSFSTAELVQFVDSNCPF